MFEIELICCACEMILSPEDKDRIARFAFRQHGVGVDKDGTMNLDSRVIIFAKSDSFKVGEKYSGKFIVKGE